MDEDLFAFNAPTFHDFDDDTAGNDDSMEMDPDEAIVGEITAVTCSFASATNHVHVCTFCFGFAK